jgi:coenzyme F420-reducing hydrogenase delta subunit
VPGKSGWEPRIIAFCCHYCAYGAADLAGSLRYRYPAGVHIIRVPCSGRVDERFILRALARGADGVLVAGCLEGTCHYVAGNVRAAWRVQRARALLAEMGLEPERVEMFRVSASMGAAFAAFVRDFARRVRNLGPLAADTGEGGAGDDRGAVETASRAAGGRW